jgi:hypothetical protein
VYVTDDVVGNKLMLNFDGIGSTFEVWVARDSADICKLDTKSKQDYVSASKERNDRKEDNVVFVRIGE